LQNSTFSWVNQKKKNRKTNFKRINQPPLEKVRVSPQGRKEKPAPHFREKRSGRTWKCKTHGNSIFQAMTDSPGARDFQNRKRYKAKGKKTEKEKTKKIQLKKRGSVTARWALANQRSRVTGQK